MSATLALLVFFRTDFFSGFNTLYGDRFDGMIETALLEHWFNVFRGVSHWSQTLFFYPVPGTLGYNDGYFIMGAIYAVFRAFGFDPFLAGELTDIVIKLSGFVGFSLFATRCLRLKLWAATLGASIFTIANSSYIQGIHVQLFTVGFAPLLATIIYECVHAIGRRDQQRAALYGASSALFLSAWLLTAFYTAWFFLLFAALLTPVLAMAFRGADLRSFVRNLRACPIPVTITAATFAVSVTPFLHLYLPKASETGMHTFSETLQYVSGPLDSLNLSGDSLLYAGLQHRLQPFFSRGYEHATGFTPILLLAFVISSIGLLRRWPSGRYRVVVCMAVASVMLWLLTIHVGRHTLWVLAYKFIPGAKGVRVISRVQVFLEWPVATVAVAGLEAAVRSVRARAPTARFLLAGCLSTVASLLLIEQFNRWEVPQVDRRVELAWLHSIKPPPKSCRAFYVSKGRPADPRFGQRLADLLEHGISAMFLAEWFGRPTINGFATFLPPQWNLLSINKPDYLSRVTAYAQTHHLEDLCSIDLKTNRWATD